MKKGLVILVLTLSFFGFVSLVRADSVQGSTIVSLAGDNAQNCKALFGNPDKAGDFAYYLQIILDVIKYAGIVLCIVLSVVDWFKALLGEDKEMYKPLAKKMAARVFYAVALWFLPAIVKTLLTLLDVYGICGIG